MSRVLLGFILGAIVVLIGALAWLQFGNVPVAVADPPLPLERLITSIPLHARIERELVNTPSVSTDGNSLVAGAQVYRDQCAACHGFRGKASSFGEHMYPDAPQLWEQHANSDVVGVSDDPADVTYWKVANGIRLTGMPSFKKVLTETQMWQVSVLLASANKPLPPAAVEILHGKALSAPVSAASPAPPVKHQATVPQD